MRTFLAACLLGLPPPLPTAASAAGAAFDVKRLDPELAQAGAAEVTSGALDDRFLPRSAMSSWPRATDYWLRLTLPEAFLPRDVPTVNVRKGRNMTVEMFVVDHGQPVPLRLATHVPGFVGAQDAIYILPAGLLTALRVDQRASRVATTIRNGGRYWVAEVDGGGGDLVDGLELLVHGVPSVEFALH